MGQFTNVILIFVMNKEFLSKWMKVFNIMFVIVPKFIWSSPQNWAPIGNMIKSTYTFCLEILRYKAFTYHSLCLISTNSILAFNHPIFREILSRKVMIVTLVVAKAYKIITFMFSSMTNYNSRDIITFVFLNLPYKTLNTWSIIFVREKHNTSKSKIVINRHKSISYTVNGGYSSGIKKIHITLYLELRPKLISPLPKLSTILKILLFLDMWVEHLLSGYYFIFDIE